MIRLRPGAGRLFLVVAGVAAVAGALLPWEQVTVRAAGQTQGRTLDSFHGSGLAACLGAALLLLMLADSLLRPRRSLVRDAGVAVAGLLLAVGAALFTAVGGYPPVNGAGYEVGLLPGLLLAGAGGFALLLRTLVLAAWRRAGSRSPASSAAPAPR